LKVLPVFRILEILARIRIIGSVPEKTDMDTYKCIRIFFTSFWWYWNAIKFKNVSYPVKFLISSQKFRDISRYEISRNFAKWNKLFREIRSKYFAKFRDREISSTTLIGRNHFTISVSCYKSTVPILMLTMDKSSVKSRSVPVHLLFVWSLFYYTFNLFVGHGIS
jgi:hypothetical protein